MLRHSIQMNSISVHLDKLCLCAMFAFLTSLYSVANDEFSTLGRCQLPYHRQTGCPSQYQRIPSLANDSFFCISAPTSHGCSLLTPLANYVTTDFDDEFQTLLDKALETGGLDAKIDSLSKIIQDDQHKSSDRNKARLFRMKLFIMRNKQGDLLRAIKDAKSLGKQGIPVSFDQDSLIMAYSKNGKPVRTPVTKGEILTISTMDNESFWISAVDGDSTKVGWLNKSKLLDPYKRLSISSELFDIRKADDANSQSLPTDDDSFDMEEFEIKILEAEINRLEKLIATQKLPYQRRAQIQRDLKEFKRLLSKVEEGSKVPPAPEAAPNIFDGGRNGGGGGILGGRRGGQTGGSGNSGGGKKGGK